MTNPRYTSHSVPAMPNTRSARRSTAHLLADRNEAIEHELEALNIQRCKLYFFDDLALFFFSANIPVTAEANNNIPPGVGTDWSSNDT